MKLEYFPQQTREAKRVIDMAAYHGIEVTPVEIPAIADVCKTEPVGPDGQFVRRLVITDECLLELIRCDHAPNVKVNGLPEDARIVDARMDVEYASVDLFIASATFDSGAGDLLLTMTRTYLRDEIAEVFRVPPSLLEEMPLQPDGVAAIPAANAVAGEAPELQPDPAAQPEPQGEPANENAENVKTTQAE